MAPVVVGISGASGITLGIRLLDCLTEMGEEVHLVVSRDACYTAVVELGKGFGKAEHFFKDFPEKQRDRITLCGIGEFTAPIASGSFLTKGMCIVPCSMATLAAMASGIADNLLRRAADVHLKERRRLVIAPREAPFSQIHLENMLKMTQMGAVIHPPIPAWYMLPKSLEEAEEFMVHRMIDALGLEVDYRRYGS